MSGAQQIILASASQFRATLLTNAGVIFKAVPAEIDERAVEQPMIEAGLGGEDIAEVLAQAKAMDVSANHVDAWVIGSDQTLSMDNKLFHKPADMEEARARLIELSGKTHFLNSAVALVRNEQLIWSHLAVSAIKMRNYDPGFVGRHLADVGEIALSSVGAYQIEGKGVQLFEEIKGDFFSIMGLPLLPLLAEMRTHGLMDG